MSDDEVQHESATDEIRELKKRIFHTFKNRKIAHMLSLDIRAFLDFLKLTN